MLDIFLANVYGGHWNIKSKAIKSQFYIKLYSYLQSCQGSSIAYNSKFKSQPCFPHGMKSIFISGGAKIGSNCVLFQQITIGSNTLIDSNNMGSPTIGNNCYIGSGAKVIGKITIGNNVRIGANAVVYKDIPDNCVVVGDCRIIHKKSLNNRYYSYNNGWLYFENGVFIKETVAENLKSLEALIPA